jgi:HEAT repeat protein
MTDDEQTGHVGFLGNDPRTNEELISAALMRRPDEDSYWDSVWILQRRDTLELLNRARELGQSPARAERRLGADILGQLGSPARTFPEQCVAALLEMLEGEKDADVLQAILIALGHLGQSEAIEPASQFRAHPDPGVRHGVVLALMGHEDQRAVECLIELSKDEDARNRDWATFGLGSQINLDTPAIREALIERANDADSDTRSEAITGLVERGDRRVIPVLVRELTSDCVGTQAVEAAARIAASELLPYLLALKEWWDISPGLLAQAIEACSTTSSQTNNQSATE